MPVPQIDYDDQAEQMLPTAQRKPKWIIFAKALVSQVKRLYVLFVYFMTGSVDAGYWSVATTYAKGELVRTVDGVYESLEAGNIGNAVTDTTYWLKVLGSFIGVNERVRYNSQKIVFEYALNRYFGTTFRQPTSYTGTGTLPLSDIYITTVAPVYVSFVSYGAEPLTSAVYKDRTIDFVFGDEVYLSASTYKFIIHIPAAVYSALGSTAEQIVRSFADRYRILGTTYTIQTY